MAKKHAPQTPWYSEEAGFFGPVYFKEYAEKFSLEYTQTEVDFLERALELSRGDPCWTARAAKAGTRLNFPGAGMS